MNPRVSIPQPGGCQSLHPVTSALLARLSPRSPPSLHSLPCSPTRPSISLPILARQKRCKPTSARSLANRIITRRSQPITLTPRSFDFSPPQQAYRRMGDLVMGEWLTCPASAPGAGQAELVPLRHICTRPSLLPPLLCGLVHRREVLVPPAQRLGLLVRLVGGGSHRQRLVQRVAQRQS